MSNYGRGPAHIFPQGTYADRSFETPTPYLLLFSFSLICPRGQCHLCQMLAFKGNRKKLKVEHSSKVLGFPPRMSYVVQFHIAKHDAICCCDKCILPHTRVHRSIHVAADVAAAIPGLAFGADFATPPLWGLEGKECVNRPFTFCSFTFFLVLRFHFGYPG